MKAIIGFFKQKWLIPLVGVAALCALIWLAGPLVAFANRTPLASEFNRLLAILVVVVVWAVYNLIMQGRANQKDRQLMAALARPQVDPAQAVIDEAQNEEAAALRRKFEEALQLLKQTRARGRRDRQFLYELPWYVIIGAPGAGKTTLLVNSGLRFPLSEHLGAGAIQGVGGTRNCDWLFADEAVFLDTAGRYTTQDSHQAVDAAAWRRFLDLIKKFRPRRPVNGVLVTMSMADLLRQTEEERRRHAKEVRRRIQELCSVLGIRFPIYMLLTKCDLVAGFTDFFAQLSQEERAQVWGATFPGGNAQPTDQALARFDADFDELLQRLNQRTFRRMQEERDIQRRSLILDFPRQMALLKPALKGFLHDTFSTSRFEEGAPLLRGVYFTSGTQEGTPIDRVMGLLAAAYGLDRQQMPVFSGRGKSFFITRLLKEVIFPEAELAGVDPRVERRRRWQRWTAYAALLVLTAGLCAVWSTSYVRNRRAVEQARQQLEQYQAIRGETTGREAGVRALLARLNVLKTAQDQYKERPLWMGFGLYQGDKIRSGIRHAYEQSLRNNLLPLIKVRLEGRMQARLQAREASDLEALYELLKVYLMLGDSAKMDALQAGAGIRKDWEQSFAREPQIQAQLRAHTDNLLQLPLDPVALDQALVAGARRKLNTIPLELQVYAQLKSEVLPDRSYDFRLQEALGPYGEQVFTTADGQAIQTLTIPGFFTYHGYHAVFRKRGLEFIKQTLAQNWVLENPAADQPSDLPRLHDHLQKLYFDDYVSKWRNLLDNLRLKPAHGIYQTIQILDLLAGADTPLRPLLEAVAKNTCLSRDPEAEANAARQEKASVAEPAKSATNQAQPGGAPPDLARELERHFEDLNYLVRRIGNSPPPLNDMLRSLNEVRDFLMQISSAAKSEEQALKIARDRMSGAGANDMIKRAQMEFARQPEPFKGWLSSLTAFGWKLTLDSAKSNLNAIWKTDVLALYQAGLQGRYPLFRNSRYDATMTDFSRFFAPNGTMDQFFQNHLKPFVDTSRPRWRQVAMDDQAMGLSRRVLTQLQYAAKIRDTFFAAGGPTPSVQFELKPVDLDETVAAFRLNLEGQTTVYRHGPTRPSQFQWPGPQANAGVRLTFQTIDGREVSRSEEGPWAWLRTLDKALVEPTGLSDRFMVTFQIGGFKARYELRANSVYNPFNLMELNNFRCPESF
ncbi:MAG: type VI secretion system membrane subunit TssM [Desulfobacterales bacterium]|nr:MAG: type VI secretion system membrane subunit TssM [Desulfobacterales bacterium]